MPLCEDITQINLEIAITLNISEPVANCASGNLESSGKNG